MPDLRWFAGSRAGLATAMVRALLAGPAPYLRGAVTSGAPGMTTLGVDAVPTSGGTAQIDLSSSALAATSGAAPAAVGSAHRERCVSCPR